MKEDKGKLIHEVPENLEFMEASGEELTVEQALDKERVWAEWSVEGKFSRQKISAPVILSGQSSTGFHAHEMAKADPLNAQGSAFMINKSAGFWRYRMNWEMIYADKDRRDRKRRSKSKESRALRV